MADLPRLRTFAAGWRGWRVLAFADLSVLNHGMNRASKTA
jgi:hypothetical protein